MSQLLTSNAGALRLLMTEDIFLLKEDRSLPPPAGALKPEPVKEEMAQPAPVTDFLYLGENNKYFLILVNDQKHAYLNKEDQEMLLKILQAKGLELRDVAILNLNRYPGVPFGSLKDFFAPSRMVLFGIDPQTVGLPAMPSNEPQKTNDVKMLATYHFDEMKEDVNKKRALWNVLKSF